MRFGTTALFLISPFMLVAQAACGDLEDNRTVSSPGGGMVASVVVPETTGTSEAPAISSQASTQCRAEIGAAAAQKLADRCRAVSPATHPPCHPGNSCTLIQGEIDRSCVIWQKDKSRLPPKECSG